MLVDRNGANYIGHPRLVDAPGNPIDDLAHDGFTLHVIRPGLDDDWVDVTANLKAGTPGGWEAYSWVKHGTVNGLPQDGTYQLGIPQDWIVAGRSTQVRFQVASNPFQYDVVEASGSLATANEAEIADNVLAEINAIRAQLLGVVDNGNGEDITLTQSTDWDAADGRAIEFSVTHDGVDFSSATAAFGTSQVDGESLAASASILNPTVGSCTVRLEFSNAQISKPPGLYQFNVVIVQPDGDRIPGPRGTITLVEDYTT